MKNKPVKNPVKPTKPVIGRNGSILLDEETCTLIKENTTSLERTERAVSYMVTTAAVNSWLNRVNRVPKDKEMLIKQLKEIAKKRKQKKELA